MLSPRTFRWLRLGLAALFILAGLNHFRAPEGYARIIPPFLPAPRTLVLVSGVFEVLGGLGLLWERTRVIAAWGLFALLIAVLPANIYMAWANVQLGSVTLPRWVLWARVPLQLPLLAWAFTLTRGPRP